MNDSKYLWLIAENGGNTANNNSYYFWKYIVNHYDDVDARFIATDNVIEQLRPSLNEKEQQKIVRKNSLQHSWLFFQADMYFVTLGFSDVRPTKLLFKKHSPMPEAPVVYLKHGTLGIKRVEYKADYANNSLVRYMYYNPTIAEQLTAYNGLKKHQLYYGIYPPRYMELVRRSSAQPQHDGRKILWFVTWREYFGKNSETEGFVEDICRVIGSPRLQKFLSQKGNKLTICLHQKFKKLHSELISNMVSQFENVKLVTPEMIDVMDAVVEHDILVTDYSSLGFDFTFLHKPVILYQPDREVYFTKRNLYCTKEELFEYSTDNRNTLISMLLSENLPINQFFWKRMAQTDDYDGVQQGKYIARMYDSILEFQRSCIVFFGYDFSGIGGTVSATTALAEGLQEQGKLVRFITLKQQHTNKYPPGVPSHPIYNHRRLLDKVKAVLFGGFWNFGYLKDDHNKKNLHAVCGYGMKYWMKHLHADTIVSTRESLNMYIQQCSAPLVKNKICFFHAPFNMIDDLFYNHMIERINTMGVDKAVFVTEQNRKGLKETFGLTNYKQFCILGNSLDSQRSSDWDEIRSIELTDGITCAYLLRLSEARKDDIDHLIAFACHLKDKGEEQISIDVYGTGDYLDTFLDLVKQNGLRGIIHYMGFTQDVKRVYQTHDCVLDFSEKQSFGMTYIEALLNGRMVFCYPNAGSREVLRDIPEAVVSSHEEMRQHILALPNYSPEKMRDYYNLIYDRFSRESVSRRFLDFLEEPIPNSNDIAPC